MTSTRPRRWRPSASPRRPSPTAVARSTTRRRRSSSPRRQRRSPPSASCASAASDSVLQVVVLAAGQGKRMFSDLPKVLHALAGRPLLAHVLDAARELRPERLCVVVGHGADRVRAALAGPNVAFATQERQLGTGHAVMQALPALAPGGTVLVLYGDVPLSSAATLRPLVDAALGGSAALLTQVVEEPGGYGRIVRDARGSVARIVEDKDATDAERAIGEINTGIMAMPRARLESWLARLGNANAQGEYYLTDVIAAAVADGVDIEVRHPSAPHECLGVNSKTELAILERHYQMNRAAKLLEQGVTLADPARIDVRGELSCGRDVSIDVNCIFEGRVRLADGVKVGANCILRDVDRKSTRLNSSHLVTSYAVLCLKNPN